MSFFFFESKKVRLGIPTKGLKKGREYSAVPPQDVAERGHVNRNRHGNVAHGRKSHDG
jgi:hypothetical protein